MFRNGLFTAVVALVCVAGCARPATQVTTSVDPSGGVHTVTTTATPTPSKPKVDFIRSTKFGEQTWTDVIGELKPQLKGGKGSAGVFSYALGQQKITYADANGDGIEDALVPLDVSGSAGTITYLYVWIWDPSKQRAIQLEDPVGHYSACGHTLVSTAPGQPMGFQIDELYRDVYDNQACGTQPLHKFSRTVGVDKWALVMTKPVLGYGGICYQTYRDTTNFDTPRSVKVGPSAGVDEAASVKRVYNVVPEYADTRHWGDGWVQVGWLTEEMAKQNLNWGVCGFLWQK